MNAANLERFPQYKELLINAGFHTVVTGWHDHQVKSVKTTLYLMWGGALFVLLIGCVNVANLVLVRARTRQKELATRLALGGGRWQLARQLVIEGVMLSLIAAAAGLLLGQAALRAVGTMNLQDLPYGAEIGLDGVVVLYALAALDRDRLRDRPHPRGRRAARQPEPWCCAKRAAARPAATAPGGCAAS